MAKVKNPLNSIQARGTAGGLIYSQNRYGQYTRDYVSPVQPDTAGQISWQDAMATAHAYWNDISQLTPVRLGLWFDFAKTYTYKNKWGNQVHLAAKEWFIKFNLFRITKGLSVYRDPPKAPGIFWFPDINIFWDTDGIYIDCFPLPEGEEFLHCRKSGPHSHTRNFCPNTMEFAAYVDSTSTGPIKLVDSADIDTDPHNWFFRIRAIDGFGRSSSPIYFTVFTYGTAPTTVFMPTGNTFLDDSATTTNRSAATRVRFRTDLSGNTCHGLIELDLSSLTYSYVTKSFFYVFPESSGSIDGIARLYQDESSYVNNECTWIEEFTGQNWSVAGGSSGVDYNADYFSSLDGDSSSLTWLRFDITTQMNLWLGGLTPTRFWGICPFSNTNFSFESINNPVVAERCFILNVPYVTV